jgi:hypothetical protein
VRRYHREALADSVALECGVAACANRRGLRSACIGIRANRTLIGVICPRIVIIRNLISIIRTRRLIGIIRTLSGMIGTLIDVFVPVSAVTALCRDRPDRLHGGAVRSLLRHSRKHKRGCADRSANGLSSRARRLTGTPCPVCRWEPKVSLSTPQYPRLLHSRAAVRDRLRRGAPPTQELGGACSRVPARAQLR